jgi:hypothetical protein
MICSSVNRDRFISPSSRRPDSNSPWRKSSGAGQNPNNSTGDGFWHATLVWGTDCLSQLIDAHLQPHRERDNELNPSFIEALEQIFAENDVPWSDKPLLPVMPNAGA